MSSTNCKNCDKPLEIDGWGKLVHSNKIEKNIPAVFCDYSNKTAEWYTDEEVTAQDKIDQFIEDYLPHGSGIDCDWTVDKTANFIYFRNSYHAMSENGFYDGWQDFSVKISLEDWENGTSITLGNNFQLQFNGDRRTENKYFLRDYLTETIYHSLTYSA